MKKARFAELQPEHSRDDLGKEVRRKYLEAYGRVPTLVLLSADVAKAFSTEEPINDSLRSVIDIAKRSVGVRRRSARRAEKSRPG
jgi:hypothetical protein